MLSDVTMIVLFIQLPVATSGYTFCPALKPSPRNCW